MPPQVCVTFSSKNIKYSTKIIIIILMCMKIMRWNKVIKMITNKIYGKLNNNLSNNGFK